MDLIITDVKLRRWTVSSFAPRQRARDPHPVLVITGQGNIEDAIRAALRRLYPQTLRHKRLPPVKGCVANRNKLVGSSAKYLLGERALPDPHRLDALQRHPISLQKPGAGRNVQPHHRRKPGAVASRAVNAMFHGNLESHRASGRRPA